MMNKSDLEKRIDEVLDSVNNIERAVPKPFFFTRLEARLKKEEHNFWDSLSRLISKPAIAAAALSLVLILNTFVVVQGMTGAHHPSNKNDMASVEDLRATSDYD